MLRHNLILIILLHIMNKALSLFCSRYPINTITSKTPVDDNFAILINENPQTYVLGQEYNISLNSFNGLRYVSFNIALENEYGDVGYKNELGHFELFDSVETRYSARCDSMVENTNTNPKTIISVTWVAPEKSGSGCILIRATVVQNRDIWYMDDGALTRRICEKLNDDIENQSVLSSEQPCCACDEARYDVIFESLWSRNIHPKDFPIHNWLTRFSDIVGASHSTSYRFWEYGNLATAAMKEFAEHGLTDILEREFDAHFKSGEIRTVIKARGPAYPNLNTWSVATVRVDRKRHLLSLAAKINPSPDWIVGVSGMELCLTNCTWLEHKILPLYPSDLGTQAGPTYVSPTQPQVPPDVIRSMRTDFFNDSRSPFYDKTGVHMKPLATLTVKRQRLYNRLCDDKESNNIDIPRECQTHPWSPWSSCTTKCGIGMQYRSRVYKQKELARIYNCDDFIINKENRACEGESCNSDDFESLTKNSFKSFEKNQEECRLTDWGPWSECNATCGDGVRKRTRQYVNDRTENQCQHTTYDNLSEYEMCSDNFCVGGAPRENKNVLENDDKIIIESNGKWDSSYKLDTRDIQSTSINGVEDANNIGKFDVYDQIKEFQNTHRKLSYNLNKKSSQEQSINDKVNFRNKFEYTPTYCYEPIQTYLCSNAAIVGNYWFYNHCTNECMLYTADSCDHNKNKFSSLEMCESNCRRKDITELSKMKQLEDCK